MNETDTPAGDEEKEFVSYVAQSLDFLAQQAEAQTFLLMKIFDVLEMMNVSQNAVGKDLAEFHAAGGIKNKTISFNPDLEP